MERDVSFPGRGNVETYHCLGQAETVGILAIDPAGRIAIVRQYRPAVDAFVWELPAGMIDTGDTPEMCCRQELEQEVGLRAEKLIYLGTGWPDTGRLSYRHHAWFVPETSRLEGFDPEPGVQAAFVELDELYRAIRRGDFPHQLHVAIMMHAIVAGLLPPPRHPL